MTGSSIVDARISEFTLALLEGSGWYQVDYTMTEPFNWGEGQGCPFLDEPCFNRDTLEPNFEEYCSPLMAQGCSFTSRAIATCGTWDPTWINQNLPSSENYWGNYTIVLDSLVDNCPYFIGSPVTDCEVPANAVSAFLSEEFYGQGSRCLEGTLSSFGGSRGGIGGYCFFVEVSYNLNTFLHRLVH